LRKGCKTFLACNDYCFGQLLYQHFFAVHSGVTRVGNYDIRAYENISVFNETKQNEILLKPKVFVQKCFRS
jgi:hypothetical protein